MLYIGIDLGTSAVKLLLMDGGGDIKNIISKDLSPGVSLSRLEPAGTGGLEAGGAGGHTRAAEGL